MHRQSTIIVCNYDRLIHLQLAAVTAWRVPATQALLQMLSQAPAVRGARRYGAASGGGTYHGGQAFAVDGRASSGPS